MTTQQRALKRLSVQQRTVYEIICRDKFIRTTGNQLNTCLSLVRAGLIKQNMESEYKNEFIIDGDPVTLPVKCSHPLEVVGVRAPSIRVKKKPVEIEEPEVEEETEPKHISFKKAWVRPAAIYDNTSREQHVAKYVKGKVADTVLPVKCLYDFQMTYIVCNWEQQPAKEMAEHLMVDVLYVRMFCQLNGLEPPKKRKLDTYHAIPHEKKLRMKREGYNGPQKKTA